MPPAAYADQHGWPLGRFGAGDRRDGPSPTHLPMLASVSVTQSSYVPMQWLAKCAHYALSMERHLPHSHQILIRSARLPDPIRHDCPTSHAIRGGAHTWRRGIVRRMPWGAGFARRHTGGSRDRGLGPLSTEIPGFPRRTGRPAYLIQRMVDRVLRAATSSGSTLTFRRRIRAMPATSPASSLRHPQAPLSRNGPRAGNPIRARAARHLHICGRSPTKQRQARASTHGQNARIWTVRDHPPGVPAFGIPWRRSCAYGGRRGPRRTA